jgi:hypothetical protein
MMQSRSPLPRLLLALTLVLAVALAVFAFSQQQQAQEAARLAQTGQARAEERYVTAAALAQDAAATQVGAEAARATAVVQVAQANTAQAAALAAQASAESGAALAGTSAAQIAATSGAQITAAAETAQAQRESLATVQAFSTQAITTALAELDTLATAGVEIAFQLGTATAQIDEAQFGREAAEADRQAALNLAWAAATALAEREDELATAQAIISGVTATPTVPPPTAVPASPTPAATSISQVVPTSGPLVLGRTFTSRNAALRFDYPEGWVVQELDNGFIIVGSSQAVFEREGNALGAGQYQIELLVGPAQGIRGVPADGGVPEVVTALLDILANGSTPPRMGLASDIMVGDFSGSRVPGTEGANRFVMTVLDVGGGNVAIVFSSSAIEELDAMLTALDALLATIIYNAP